MRRAARTYNLSRSGRQSTSEPINCNCAAVLHGLLLVALVGISCTALGMVVTHVNNDDVTSAVATTTTTATATSTVIPFAQVTWTMDSGTTNPYDMFHSTIRYAGAEDYIENGGANTYILLNPNTDAEGNNSTALYLVRFYPKTYSFAGASYASYVMNIVDNFAAMSSTRITGEIRYSAANTLEDFSHGGAIVTVDKQEQLIVNVNTAEAIGGVQIRMDIYKLS